jgi:hypothetical protein
MSRTLGWYTRRLRQMTPREVAQRATTHARQKKWATRQVRQGSSVSPAVGLRIELHRPAGLHQVARDPAPTRVRATALAAAEQVLAGEWPLLGVVRDDLADPDWFLDPVTGVRAPDEALAFRIDHRDEAVTGNVKMVWELSRHHHLTVLAAAYWLTGDEKYAEAVDRQLRSWWRKNPFLSGIHWTSGIEIGVRLISWVWIRRLLDGWPKVEDLFEHNADAARQVRWHQEYLAAFESPGSSANNHAVAEAAGLLVASCGFPWFDESLTWRRDAAARLREHLLDNTWDDGLNRELATDYHRFVTELGLVAAAEARGCGLDLGEDVWCRLTAGLDVAAALLDCAGRAPRQGDGDEGRALVLDGADEDPWALLLSAGAATVGPCEWWPETRPSVLGMALGELIGPLPSFGERPASRPTYFEDAGLVLLRSDPADGPEIWCRCDSGPHGFLSIAAHAHADALSLEVRYAGVDVLADPGTYCYHGEAQWRSYFRSTAAHNTVEVDGRSQSVEGGPFLWTTHADAHVQKAVVQPGQPQVWVGSHTGYSTLGPEGVHHQREARLERRVLTITDRLTGPGRHVARVLFHLGPTVDVDLQDGVADLRWTGPSGARESARLGLSPDLRWSVHRGEESPPLGWYSPAFGQRVPSTTLVGCASFEGLLEVRSVIRFSGRRTNSTTRGAGSEQA